MFKNKKTIIALTLLSGMVLGLASFAGAETTAGTTGDSSNAHPMTLTVSASGRAMLRGTLKSVGTASITVTSWGGDWVVNIGSDAKLTRRFGGASNLSELQAGDNVQVNGSINQSAAWTVDAKTVKDNSIQARNADFTGTISGLSGSAFALATQSRGNVNVTVNSDAKITVNGATSTVAGLQNSMRVQVKGVWDRNQSTVMASRVVARTPKAPNASSTKDH